MPHDHFVAQTYLKHFGDPTAGGMLHAYRKTDGKEFRCWPADVCREWDGDINRLLQHRDLLGDFRKMVEPWWNQSVEPVLRGQMSDHDKFVIAAYMANLMTCTPAWRRVGVKLTRHQQIAQLDFAYRTRDQHPDAPELKAEDIQALRDGEIVLDVDPDYVKGLATIHLMSHTMILYNCEWIAIQNDSDAPFITSDNPFCLAHPGGPQTSMLRILPITPQLAVAVRIPRASIVGAQRLSPQALMEGLQRPPAGAISRVQCTTDQALGYNAFQARSAEEVIFCSEPSNTLRELVKYAAKYRLDVEHVEYPDPDGNPNVMITGAMLCVREPPET